jgi:hypothetical protein
VAASLYRNPTLATVGGFFYTVYQEKERVRMLNLLPAILLSSSPWKSSHTLPIASQNIGNGYANMGKPFILLRGPT